MTVCHTGEAEEVDQGRNTILLKRIVIRAKKRDALLEVIVAEAEVT